jgi:hypothetical protein
VSESSNKKAESSKRKKLKGAALVSAAVGGAETDS